MLGLDFNMDQNDKLVDGKCWEPTELNLYDVAPEFFSDPKYARKKEHNYYANTNPFKKKKLNKGLSPVHEGYKRRTLIVDHYKDNTSIYSSHRIVQSQASQSKMQLIEVQRQNLKLQAQVRELQRQVDK